MTTAPERADLVVLRAALDDARLARDLALAEADAQLVVARGFRAWYQKWDSEGVAPPPPWNHSGIQALERRAAGEEAAQAERRARIVELDAAVAGARGALVAHLGSGSPIGGAGTADTPVALLPIRLETVFLGEPGARRLAIRVYPDEVSVDALDRRLSPREIAAGRAYWAAPGAEAWARMVETLRPTRAAWTARATRPGAPEPSARAEGETRAPVIRCLPERWRFLGSAADRTVLDVLGRDIPRPLTLDLTTADGAWLTDLDAAVEVGMAVVVDLPPEVEVIDELLVVGVSASDPAAAVRELEELFEAHAFTDGLAFVPAGTPTNNTPQARSAWSSAPAPPGPDVPATRSGGAADAVELALGLGTGSLLNAVDGAQDAWDAPAVAMSRLLWGVLRGGLVRAASLADTSVLLPDEMSPTDPPARTWQALGEFVAEHARSRGTVPSLRVGRQPYGVLPVTSVDEWTPSGLGPSPDSHLLHVREMLGLDLIEPLVAVDLAEQMVTAYREVALRRRPPQDDVQVGYALHVLANVCARAVRRLEADGGADPDQLAAVRVRQVDAAREAVRRYLDGMHVDPGDASWPARAHVGYPIGMLPADEAAAARAELAKILAAAEGGGS